MNRQTHILIIISLVLSCAPSWAKKAPNRQFEQILPERNLVAAKNNSDFISQGASYNINFKSQGQADPEEVARAYINDVMSKHQTKQAAVEFELLAVREGLATTTVRFKQTHQGYDVYGGSFTVSINQDGVVKFTTQQVYQVGDLPATKNKQANEIQAMAIASAYFGHLNKQSEYSETKPVIYVHNGQTRLVYQVEYMFHNKMDHWQLLVDTHTGEIIRAADQLHYDAVDATVFDPDPLSSSGQSYGGAYTDGNDRNNSQLTAELKTFPIEVMNQNGTYSLNGQWAQSFDVEGPFEGDFSQSSSDFTYNRGDNSFEAVNTFFHLSNYLGYLNDTLNLDVKPYQYSTGIRFDAHGQDDADNSYYSSQGLLVFGEGCVDDAEDADVIIHELGHGIHDWITLGGLSQVNGLSEGLGDYFAQSYSRSRPGFAWNANDAEYNYVFSWDGHNECWNGRTTNYNRTYPGGLVQQIHTDGQIWSTCLMKIWDQVGREKTDTMVIEGISMTGANTNQAEAAQAVLQAAVELGYGSDLNTIADTFNSCGYDVQLASQLGVEIETQSTQLAVGESITFSANISDGQGPYTYQWDINGDGAVDGTEESITVRYAQTYQGQIKADVVASDSTTGAAVFDVNVLGAEVEMTDVNAISDNLQQVCGNNDAVLDPGERWSAPVNASNVGNKTATDAYLAMGLSRANPVVGQSDAFGNTVNGCDRLFIDITQTGALKTWDAAGMDYPANDEGSVLIQFDQSFDHYGQSVSQLRASTNGYFSTSANADGSDWSNDCPLPAMPNLDDAGARIAPMHDDLKASEFYHQSFTTCPRPAETGADLGCEVFTWQGADLWDTQSDVEDIDVQAILYPETSQWVYQYDGTGIKGSASTSGMQNSAATDGLTYACDTANSINTSTAVCTFNKDHQPDAGAASYVMLESPVISLGDILANQSKSSSMVFAISEDAACGSSFSINHQAAVYDEGFNAGQNNILSQTIGSNGQCNVVTNCGVGNSDESHNDIVPRPGLWWNPDRNGNGFDWYTIGDDRLVYFFYTGDASGEPIWYLANDAESRFNQYYNNITQYKVPGGFGSGEIGFDLVGWSNTSFIDDSIAIQVRSINGQLSAEKQYFFQYAANNTANMHTGSYYTPTDSGWGHSVGTLGNARVVINYIYDQAGNPYWAIGNGANDNSEIDMYYVNTFCPSCPAVTPVNKLVGDIKMTLNGQTNGTLNYFNITDEGVNWDKSNLPIENIIPPSN